MAIKYLFLDFNGTILNDVDLCLDLLNKLLKKQNKPLVDIEEYKHIFTFPVKDYYIKAGLDFNIESFESMAHTFIKEYTPLSLKCGLYDGVIDTLKYLRNKNIKLILLSASEINNLMDQCNSYNITKYFDDIIGTSNIYAESKEKLGIEYMNKNHLNKNDCMFIGDTLHDYEVSKSMGINSMLVECGHQAYDVILKSGTTIIKDLKNLMEII